MSALPELFRQLALNLVVTVVGFQFPDVPTLSTQQLSQWLDGSRPAPVLIDTREPREYAVSHLPGALESHQRGRHCGGGDTDETTHRGVLLDRASFRRSRQAAPGHGLPECPQPGGFHLPVAEAGAAAALHRHPVNKVHPFDDLWGALLSLRRCPIAEADSRGAGPPGGRGPGRFIGGRSLKSFHQRWAATSPRDLSRV